MARRYSCGKWTGRSSPASFAPVLEREEDDRGCEQGQDLTENQSAGYGNTKRLPKLMAHSAAEDQRERREKSGEGRHHDRTKSKQCRLPDRQSAVSAFLAHRVEREIDHHDRVLLHDPNQENDANDADDPKARSRGPQANECPNASRGKSRQDRHRMDKTFVKHSKHDVDNDYSREDQPELVGKRSLECACGT